MIREINDMVSVISEWVRCPICGNKTRLQIRADTELSQNIRKEAVQQKVSPEAREQMESESETK